MNNSNFSDSTFDTIIYSANFAGVVAASLLKSMGEKVLILNRYGFFGGTITESLNLYQKKIKWNDKAKGTAQIVGNIIAKKDGILYEDEDHFILNPEIVKYILQKKCEENNLELLFHIIPYKIDFDEEFINLIVIGKEGEIRLKCKKIFDLSTEFTLAPLVDKSSRNFVKSFVNFISLPLKDEEILGQVFRKIILKDNRLWISIEHENVNLLTVEEIAQKDFDFFDDLLRKNQSRIQVVPAQSNLIFNFFRTEKFDKRISLITDFISSFNPEDEILIAAEIEKGIKDEFNF